MASNEALAKAWDEGVLAERSTGGGKLFRVNPYRKPPVDCGVCHAPATRLSSFGEEYWKHPDGTVHEVYFAEPTA